MSVVSIHRIYSSVTLLFAAALLPSENTQVRTKFIAPTGRASFFQGQTGFIQFTSQADHSARNKETNKREVETGMNG